MAGQPGRSGGARAGAGRKPKQKLTEAALDAVDGQEPLDFLLSVQNDPTATPSLRVRAAIAAAQYLHTKRHDGGKKEQAADKAQKTSAGRFAPSAPPLKLVAKR